MRRLLAPSLALLLPACAMQTQRPTLPRHSWPDVTDSPTVLAQDGAVKFRFVPVLGIKTEIEERGNLVRVTAQIYTPGEFTTETPLKVLQEQLNARQTMLDRAADRGLELGLVQVSASNQPLSFRVVARLKEVAKDKLPLTLQGDLSKQNLPIDEHRYLVALRVTAAAGSNPGEQLLYTPPVAASGSPEKATLAPGAPTSLATALLTGTPPAYWGKQHGRFAYGFYAGVILSQGRDSFSELDPYLRFKSDVRLGKLDKHDEPNPGNKPSWLFDPHLTADFSLTTVPVAPAPADPDQSYLRSKKSFSGSVGLDLHFLHWEALDDYNITIAGSSVIGLDTVDAEANGGSVRDYWGAGVKIMGGLRPSKGKHNPLPLHYAAVYTGDFEDLGSKRIFTDMGLVINEELGLFIGLQSNTGSGPDDVRVLLGFTTNLDWLFQGLRGLTPGGTQTQAK